jgi:hypothetical protein
MCRTYAVLMQMLALCLHVLQLAASMRADQHPMQYNAKGRCSRYKHRVH